MEMFQRDYYYVRIKGYIVSAQEILVHAQDSCACTRACTTLLRMHNTLVHALEGPRPKAGTQKERWPRHAQECRASTRNLCMHKNLGSQNKPLLLGSCAAFTGFLSGKKGVQKNNNA